MDPDPQHCIFLHYEQQCIIYQGITWSCAGGSCATPPSWCWSQWSAAAVLVLPWTSTSGCWQRTFVWPSCFSHGLLEELLLWPLRQCSPWTRCLIFTLNENIHSFQGLVAFLSSSYNSIFQNVKKLLWFKRPSLVKQNLFCISIC